MATAFTGVLTAEDIALLTADPAVAAARSRLDSSNVVYTSASLPATTRSRLQETLGLNLGTMESVPMSWIRGDTPAHTDVGRSTFEKTYLVYMNDSPGSLVVDGVSHPITQGTAYVFSEGAHHETVGTGSEPRLLLGPMSERAFPVGVPPAESNTCCQAALDLKGLDYQTRAQVIAGINILNSTQRKPMSYSEYLSMKKAISTKRK
jgi:hypothetical protein